MDTWTKTLAEMAAEVDQYCRDKGWREHDTTFGEAMALLHSEIAEASDAWRRHGLKAWYTHTVPHGGRARLDDDDRPPKPEGVPSEFADIFIRLLDDSVLFKVPLDDLMRMHLTTYRASGSFLENMDGLHRMVAKASEFHDEGGGSFRYQLARVLGFLRQLCDLYGIDLEAEYQRKMDYNKTRPFKHGNLFQ